MPSRVPFRFRKQTDFRVPSRRHPPYFDYGILLRGNLIKRQTKHIAKFLEFQT